jgi:hypothetical protein
MAATLPEFAQTGPSAHSEGETTVPLLLEPDSRLWKVSYRPLSRMRALIELVVLGFFFLFGLAAMSSFFAGLSQLFQS